MAFIDTPLGLQLGSGFLIGLALSGTTFSVVLAVIARVVPPAQRTTALGVATAAGSFGQFVLLPVGQWLIVGARLDDGAGRAFGDRRADDPARRPARPGPPTPGNRSARHCARHAATAAST